MIFDPLQLAIPGVRALQPYQPGKPNDIIQREFGNEPIVNLASNENPRAPDSVARDFLDGCNEPFSRYPDGSGHTLKNALAQNLDVTPNQITLGNGSNDVLELLVKAFVSPGEGVVVSEHAFAVYSLAASAVGAELKTAPAVEWGHDLQAMRDLVDRKTKLVFIANPNNPTGTWISETEVCTFLDSLPGSVITVIDEAYFEYFSDAQMPDAVHLLNRYPALVATRTFSKIYGLAGFRVGYGVSSPEIADILNRVRQPFNVNSLALAAAERALKDEDFLIRSRELNNQGMIELVNGMSSLGLRSIPSIANFLSVDLQRPAFPVFEKMLQRGVLVRPIANYGMPNHLRFTIGLEEENSKALDALEQSLIQ